MPKRTTRKRAAIEVIGPSITYISLAGEAVALIDREDADHLVLRNWKRSVARGKSLDKFYASTNQPSDDGKRLTLSMHRFLMQAEPGQLVDHANGNGLDNRRANLRFVDTFQSQVNKGLSPLNTSGFKGVHKLGNSWVASIRTRAKRLHLGSFSAPELAAKAYNLAAEQYHGEYARKS